MPANGGGTVVISTCGRTHRGRVRPENQDRLLVADLAEGILDAHTAEESGRGSAVGPLRFELTDRGVILLVADGMGGRAGGARASTLAVTAVRRAMSDGAAENSDAADAFVGRLRGALVEANRDILQEAERNERLRGMGTTATLAGIRDDKVFLAQVGDSRAYLVRAGVVAQLTRDQSLVQDLIDSGVLDEKDARTVRRNVILQALGSNASVEPVVTYHDLRRGDVLLLCSDGLSQVVQDDEMVEAVMESADCLTMCDRLVGLANDRGGPDNITVLVARVEGDGLVPASGTDVVQRREWTTGAS